MNLKIPVTQKEHSQGKSDAPITLIEYGDYQCSDCGRAYAVIKQLQEHFGDEMRFVFRNFPLDSHPLAKPAAEAAEFANEHGKFWEMHDLIYENQKQLSIELLHQLAVNINLPIEEFKSAIEQKKYEAKIREDLLGGIRSGVNRTPTFFINGERYKGSDEFESLRSAIEPLVAR
jgi:protein-disulfide isomerase